MKYRRVAKKKTSVTELRAETLVLQNLFVRVLSTAKRGIGGLAWDVREQQDSVCIAIVEGWGNLGYGTEAASLAAPFLTETLCEGKGDSSIDVAIQAMSSFIARSLETDQAILDTALTAMVAVIEGGRAEIGWAGDAQVQLLADDDSMLGCTMPHFAGQAEPDAARRDLLQRLGLFWAPARGIKCSVVLPEIPHRVDREGFELVSGSRLIMISGAASRHIEIHGERLERVLLRNDTVVKDAEQLLLATSEGANGRSALCIIAELK